MADLRERARWAVARWMHRHGLPYWWVTPRWTAEELADIKGRGRERYEQMKRHFS